MKISKELKLKIQKYSKVNNEADDFSKKINTEKEEISKLKEEQKSGLNYSKSAEIKNREMDLFEAEDTLRKYKNEHARTLTAQHLSTPIRQEFEKNIQQDKKLNELIKEFKEKALRLEDIAQEYTERFDELKKEQKEAIIGVTDTPNTKPLVYCLNLSNGQKQAFKRTATAIKKEADKIE